MGQVVKLKTQQHNGYSLEVNKFFYSYHQAVKEYAVILDRSGRAKTMTPNNNRDTCSCQDLYVSCLHRFVATLALLPLGFTTVTAYLVKMRRIAC